MVRRYDLEDTEDGVAELVERKHGDWVSFDDFEAVAQEVAELRVIIADAIEHLNRA